MKVQRTKEQVQATIEGAIGETTPLFTLPIGTEIKELIVDMARTTYINSIGVKHWIMWTNKVPRSTAVKLVQCPFVIVSQASTVVGFMTPNMKIESFFMPYACDDCGREENRSAVRGQDYEYASPDTPRMIKVPTELPCPKCGKKLEPDFFIEKTFKFLG